MSQHRQRTVHPGGVYHIHHRKGGESVVLARGVAPTKDCDGFRIVPGTEFRVHLPDGLKVSRFVKDQKFHPIEGERVVAIYEEGIGLKLAFTQSKMNRSLPELAGYGFSFHTEPATKVAVA